MGIYFESVFKEEVENLIKNGEKIQRKCTAILLGQVTWISLLNDNMN